MRAITKKMPRLIKGLRKIRILPEEMSAVIIRNQRKSLITPQRRFLNALGIKNRTVQITEMNSVKLKDLAYQLVDEKQHRIMFTNGSDKKDAELVSLIREINPSQKLLFCELGWLPYQKFMFFDSKGFGNISELHDWPIELFPAVDNNVWNWTKKYLNHELNPKVDAKGRPTIEAPDEEYILVPLQVDNDSKIIVGSPHFRTVSEFIDYIMDVIPKNLKIYFKNHPQNKKPPKVPISLNSVDITHANYNKLSLINNAKIVVGINTTFLLESLYLNKPVISFGLDVFSNKDIILDGFGKKFDDWLNFSYSKKAAERFLCELMRRQVLRVDVPEFDVHLKNHFWKKQF
ncbi:hypothetical protein ACFL03_14765 [Thermodesulfobacteriota bacterium]